MNSESQSLIDAAIQARQTAYAPYSKFKVGAALLCADGEVFRGCNVENLSFGLTSCAERNAVFAAVAAGRQKFSAIAVVTDSDNVTRPCGACRQVLCEFGDFPVLLSNLAGEVVKTTVSELLPNGQTGILGRD